VYFAYSDFYIFLSKNYKNNINVHTKTRGESMQTDKKVSKKEDMTKYGEFVCSAYHWLPVEKQKEQAKRLENITRENKQNGNKDK